MEGWTLEGGAERSLAVDPGAGSLGRGALVATVRGATMSVLARRLDTPVDLAGVEEISFFYRYVTELFFLSEKKLRTIGLRLRSDDRGCLEYIPEYPAQGAPSEDRYSWVFFQAPVSAFTPVGAPRLSAVSSIEVLFGPEVPADCIFRLDALAAGRRA